MNGKRIELLDHIMNRELEAGTFVGMSLAVEVENQKYYNKDFGYANREKHQKVDHETIYRMYSMTKPITSVCFMILLERGLVDIYDPVSMYLPGFRNQKVYTAEGFVDVEREVTLRDLLSMTAGVVYPDESHEPGKCMQKLFDEVQSFNESRGKIGAVEFCNRIGEQPLLFQPGTAWNYGACADVIGAVIEVVSGMSLGQFMKKEIFAPLEMKDTGFYVPKEKQHRFAELYIYSEEEKKNIVCEWRHLALTKCLKQPSFESGGAGVVSTMNDYSKFVRMLANDGSYRGIRILGKKTVEFMRKPQAPVEMVQKAGWNSNRGFGYGNFFRIAMDEANSGCLLRKGEFGWDGWAGTYFCIDPESKVSILFMVQRCGVDMGRIIRQVKNVVYSSLEE